MSLYPVPHNLPPEARPEGFLHGVPRNVVILGFGAACALAASVLLIVLRPTPTAAEEPQEAPAQ